MFRFSVAILWFGMLFNAHATARDSCRLTVAIGSERELVFATELALTEKERAIGLMNRESLAPGQGMIFDFGRERRVSMWMKDTFVPLDMAFFRDDGTLVYVERGCEPHSLRLISSPVPVRYVLEINAGAGHRLRPGAQTRLDPAELARCRADAQSPRGD
jgi:uncharacterized membrane protein (UPF0127 family)